MGCTNCNGQTTGIDIGPNPLDLKKINKDMIKEKEILKSFYKYMTIARAKAGITRSYTRDNTIYFVDIHNKLYNTNYSSSNYNDMKNVYDNLNYLYNQIRRGDIVIEEEPTQEKYSEIDYDTKEEDKEVYKTEIKEDVNKTEDRYCEKCGEKLHRMAKGNLCKKCKAL